MYTRLIRWCFARFYREFAWTYDTVAALVSGGHWHAWVLAALPLLRGRVLELGCGTGNLQHALAIASARSDAFGLDLSPQMLAHTQRRLLRSGVCARLLRGDARALPFPDATFDTLVATFPSEYIIAPATLHETQRVLRPGGRLIIILAAYWAGEGYGQRLIDLAYRLTLQGSPRDLPEELPRSQVGERMAATDWSVVERLVDAPGGRVHMIIGSVR